MANKKRLIDAIDELRAGKWLIENVGWCKGDYQKDNRNGDPVAYCAIGAALDVHTEGAPWIAHELLYEALPKKHRNDGVGVVWLNDRRTTTKDDVVRLYNRAIRLGRSYLKRA